MMAGVEEPEELRCVDTAIASVRDDIDSALILKEEQRTAIKAFVGRAQVVMDTPIRWKVKRRFKEVRLSVLLVFLMFVTSRVSAGKRRISCSQTVTLCRGPRSPGAAVLCASAFHGWREGEKEGEGLREGWLEILLCMCD
ncbi:hypothetical protein DPX16_3867 [Anabarilius grahami]|uniref:Uncharacterized protein n=1 Tax=Anabarilius grahami TaxID=495550 RepID=A0A3N0XSR9_ANAGA|nr:hypothetical protein DPX16_3867 [Anabarilius grahami]